MSAKTDLMGRKGHIRHERLPRQRAALAGRVQLSKNIWRFVVYALIALCFSLSVSVFVILTSYKGW